MHIQTYTINKTLRITKTNKKQTNKRIYILKKNTHSTHIHITHKNNDLYRYKHTFTPTHTHTHTHIHTDRQTHTHTHTQTHIET